MRGSTLSSLLLVKLESADVKDFSPEESVHIWMNQTVRRRKVNYKRMRRDADQEQNENLHQTAENQGEGEEESESEADEENILEEIVAYETSCGGDEGDEYFDDYFSEEINWLKVCEFNREE